MEDSEEPAVEGNQTQIEPPSALPLSYDNRTTTSPHNLQYS